MSARHLPKMDTGFLGGKVDPYVIVGFEGQEQKTSTKKGTYSPGEYCRFCICYAMRSTEPACCFGICYAICSTEVACCLGICYAISSTEMAYRSSICYSVPGTDRTAVVLPDWDEASVFVVQDVGQSAGSILSIELCEFYALSGTDGRYAATKAT